MTIYNFSRQEGKVREGFISPFDREWELRFRCDVSQHTTCSAWKYPLGCKPKATMVHFADKQVWEPRGESWPPRRRNSFVDRACITPNLYQQSELCQLCEHKRHCTALGSADMGTEIEGRLQNIFKHLPPLEILGVKWKCLFGSWLQWIVQGYDSDSVRSSTQLKFVASLGVVLIWTQHSPQVHCSYPWPMSPIILAGV